MDFYPLDDGASQKTLEQGNNRGRFKGWKCSPLLGEESKMETGRLLQWSKWQDDGRATGDREEGRNMKEHRGTGDI